MTRDRRNALFLSLIISAFIYASFLILFVKVLAPKKVDECIRCKQAIANYLNVQRAKQNDKADGYNDSIYSRSGSINPGFKDVVSQRVSSNEEPQKRAYEQQLAEYRRVMAEKERLRKEQERRDAEEAAKERALIEEERAESLRQEQELQKAASISTNGGIGPSKTFTPKNTKPATKQKTQIGTLRTSKLGESSFQK